jgi:uncharacterized membrane protein YecN with MAPEG domain
MFNFYWFAMFVAVNALILLLLAIRVTVLRFKHRVSLGDGGNKDLVHAIRVHANGTEHVPIFALLLLGLTFVQLTGVGMAALVIAFTLARIVHLVGILWRQHTLRKVGAALTYLLQAIAIVLLVALLQFS